MKLNPDDNQLEYWMEETLAPVYDCFNNFEMYYAKRTTLNFGKEVYIIIVQ